MATSNSGNAATGSADQVEKNIRQLGSMLSAIYGGGFEAFNEMEGARKDAYLWACHDKLAEIEQAWRAHVAALS